MRRKIYKIKVTVLFLFVFKEFDFLWFALGERSFGNFQMHFFPWASY